MSIAQAAKLLKGFGGPDRDRTDDLFHAMEARSQLRHRPTLSRRDSSIFRRAADIVNLRLPNPLSASAPPRFSKIPALAS